MNEILYEPLNGGVTFVLLLAVIGSIISGVAVYCTFKLFKVIKKHREWWIATHRTYTENPEEDDPLELRHPSAWFGSSDFDCD